MWFISGWVRPRPHYTRMPRKERKSKSLDNDCGKNDSLKQEVWRKAKEFTGSPDWGPIRLEKTDEQSKFPLETGVSRGNSTLLEKKKGNGMKWNRNWKNKNTEIYNIYKPIYTIIINIKYTIIYMNQSF